MKYKFWPSRKSGQNFLISQAVLNQIISGAQLKKDDKILEIGAGFGTLTAELLKKTQHVTAVELDRRLVGALKKLAAVDKRLTIIEGDIFQQWPVISRQLSDLNYKLVANIPYNITSLVLRNFLEREPRPKMMTLLVQKEVAQRVTAKPGRMSLLSIAVQFYAQPEIICIVPKENFWPQPLVDSAILKVEGIARDTMGYQGKLGGIGIKRFFSIVRIGFSAKRKQIHNNLAAGLRIGNEKAKRILRQSGLEPSARPQDLDIYDWLKIVQNIE